MSVLKDAVLLCHSVLVMLALRYLLQEHKLIECHEKYCTSVGNIQEGNENSYQEGFLSWVTNEQAPEDKTQCLCYKVSHHGCLTGAFTLFAFLHLVISVVVVFLKHKTFNTPKCEWIYISLIIATVLNTLLLTRIIRSDTHQDPVVEFDAKKESLLWRVLSMPFRLVWNTVASVLAMVFYNMFMGILGILGLFRCSRANARAPVIFLCSLDRESNLLSLNVMRQYVVCALSWTYTVSAVANIYSLMKSLGKEQCAQLEKANNINEEGKDNECRLCREILAAKRRSRRTKDDSDSEDSDHDSFVLGWRL